MIKKPPLILTEAMACPAAELRGGPLPSVPAMPIDQNFILACCDS